MKLQLLIPQFNETDEVMRPMLESIGTQQGVDLKNDIEVIIGNDGSDIKLSEALLGSFSYPIRYAHFEHSGLPGTRGRLFDMATADYVMFCDADDMLLTNLALYTIFAFTDRGCDALVCDFMEEVVDRKTGRSVFFPHKKDSTFVHGKVYRRQFLMDNHIVWHPDVKCHEDSGYNSLALKVAKDVKHCQIPLYLWKWREGSICRKDPLYVPKTYTRMIYSNGWLVKDLLDRGLVEEAKYYVAVLVYGTYYMLNKRIWLDPLNTQYRYETEKCFQDYYRKHRAMFLAVDPKVRDSVIAGTKRRVLREGVLLEQFTFDEWIRHIEALE
ncbi:MAG: glycosyltransferase family 2 protein [Clostridia bacterium]|nr:glycosyltransferase family 2 protein [Clostridia bacterium]MBQ6121970.1 glycosyltransferase family 2 protein [Clostridia bacterium]